MAGMAPSGGEPHPHRLLVGAGAITWVVVGAPTVAAWVSGRGPHDGRAVAWGVAYAAFAIAFGLVAWPGRLGERARLAALAVQTLAVLVLVPLGTGFEGALFCVVAGQAPLLASRGVALGWVLAQTIAMLAVELSAFGSTRGVYLAGAYAGFQLFTFGAARLAASESAARQDVARMHAELVATQELFADSTRTAERLRIARELHDALGHHLTALSLQLELARNLADGPEKEPVGQAHGLTKELLAELRTVVSAMREDRPVDLAGALRTLASGIPSPRVHLDLPETLSVEPALAHAIFRCAQEALTNAARHAGATNVFVAVEQQGDHIAVVATDDGRGASSLKAGHGLTGLRERIEAMGGSMQVDARPGEGVTLRALLPLRARSA
ncbi:MAG TPA: sensor histidine kinase [Polyangiaceae bacterium]